MAKRFGLIWALFFVAMASAVVAQPISVDTIPSASLDSAQQQQWAQFQRFRQGSFLPFMENQDSAHYWVYTAAGVGIPREQISKEIDPMSPFSKVLFTRESSAKFWFFAVALIWLFLLLYFRAVHFKQFEMRLKSVYSPYYFSELIDEKIGFASTGTWLAHSLGWSVMGMAVVNIWVYDQWLNLNSPLIYVLATTALVGWEMLVYFVSFLFSEATGLYGLVRASWQRKANASLWFGLVIFPLVLLTYYNAPKLTAYPLGRMYEVLLLVYLSLRGFWVLMGMFRDGERSLAAVLYFCGIEILPLAMLLKGLVF